jgi:XTP/dITP diphosphohydrolase
LTIPDVLAIASRNDHKVREILRICADWPVRWVTAEDDPDVDWPEVPEHADTYLENALEKARTIARVTGLPSLADDSGIEADALDGGPGVRSARFAGEHPSDEENLRKLIEAVRMAPAGLRGARYRCVAVAAWSDGREVWAEGTCEGSLIERPRGSGGFGYDPIFVPRGHEVTMSELAPEQKDEISHRGRALRELGRRLGIAG